MLDGERILARVDRFQGYLRELRQIVPATFQGYQATEKRRACERLLWLTIEPVTDICALLVSGHRLGVSGEEGDVFIKLGEAAVLPPSTVESLNRMQGLRNILVHEYMQVDDRIVYHTASERLGDFGTFIGEVEVTSIGV